jgi:hypothetical protein
LAEWRKPGGWKHFARIVLGVNLDPEQEEILDAVQMHSAVSVASGTGRGKDFVAAVAAMCFLYLTPKWNEKGELVENTKVAMTAPTGRQVKNIMFAEISRMFNRAKFLPGRLTGNDIRTEDAEWFLTGFKADDHNTEAWTGFHAVNTFFVVTEASGMPELIFNAIEGNLQGNSRILIVFNPNVSTGYAAASQRSKHWRHFRLDSLTAPNVVYHKEIAAGTYKAIPAQVDHKWVKDRVEKWCMPIAQSDYNEGKGDFYFEIDGINRLWRPNDLFRVKVRGMFPEVGEDVLVPLHWIELANDNWREHMEQGWSHKHKALRLGSDIAGMGTDSTCHCYRFGSFVKEFRSIHSGGTANHMQSAGHIVSELRANTSETMLAQSFIDTIGEGAGAYSRVLEVLEDDDILEVDNQVHSVKAGERAEYEGSELTDSTGQYYFKNMRAFLYWAIREWLNPVNKHKPCLPPDDELAQELTETKWKLLSNGMIQIEPKEELKARISRSPDKADSLSLTFYPSEDIHRKASLSGNKKETSIWNNFQ